MEHKERRVFVEGASVVWEQLRLRPCQKCPMLYCIRSPKIHSDSIGILLDPRIEKQPRRFFFSGDFEGVKIPCVERSLSYYIHITIMVICNNTSPKRRKGKKCRIVFTLMKVSEGISLLRRIKHKLRDNQIIAQREQLAQLPLISRSRCQYKYPYAPPNLRQAGAKTETR